MTIFARLVADLSAARSSGLRSVDFAIAASSLVQRAGDADDAALRAKRLKDRKDANRPW